MCYCLCYNTSVSIYAILKQNLTHYESDEEMKALERLSKWIAAILFLLIAVTLTIFLYDFYSIITRSTKTAAEEHLIQNSRTSATMIREKIQSDLDTVYALSSLLSSFEHIDSPEAKVLLKKVGNEFPFSALMVSNLISGEYYTNNDASINISETQYLIGSTGKNKAISVIFKNALYGRDMIALESPIYQNERLVGKVSGLYYSDYINNILDNAADGNGHQYQIVDRNGNFILTSDMSDFRDHKNIYSFLDSVTFSKGNKAENVIRDFTDGKPGVSSYIDNGRSDYFCYMPIQINDWYLISTAPDFGVNLRSMTIQNPTVTLAIRIIILFILLLLYILWRQIRYRAAMEKNRKELEILNKKLQVKNETLKLKAENDLLTGLYNKVTSELVIADYIENEGKGGRHALYIIDIDNFKEINDELGHIVGDKALTELANGIDHCLRTTDIKGRIGGDEFIVLLKNIHSDEDLEQKAAEICNIPKTIQLKEGFSWKLSCSVGAAIYPDHSIDFTDLFQKADKAMYYSKELGKGTFYIYNRDIEN